MMLDELKFFGTDEIRAQMIEGDTGGNKFGGRINQAIGEHEIDDIEQHKRFVHFAIWLGSARK